ncbi:unnamed protein product [Prorocentrum cordatum]|uniref:Uncharacterized protein n=1 Tax=Prorocentrum cordatum TaxID=2364126 RepID=A0ABN9XJW8_9DINO|nr:unnamed protein product [Polarella glacialis]
MLEQVTKCDGLRARDSPSVAFRSACCSLETRRVGASRGRCLGGGCNQPALFCTPLPQPPSEAQVPTELAAADGEGTAATLQLLGSHGEQRGVVSVSLLLRATSGGEVDARPDQMQEEPVPRACPAAAALPLRPPDAAAARAGRGPAAASRGCGALGMPRSPASSPAGSAAGLAVKHAGWRPRRALDHGGAGP